MSFGGGTPKPPAAQPVVPVPQDDDPRGIEEQRRAAMMAKERGGYSAHLLTGEGGVEESSGVDKPKLLPGGMG